MLSNNAWMLEYASTIYSRTYKILAHIKIVHQISSHVNKNEKYLYIINIVICNDTIIMLSHRGINLCFLWRCLNTHYKNYYGQRFNCML